MRAYLIVPGAAPEILDAALSSGADALVFTGDGPVPAGFRGARPRLLVRIGPIETVDEARLGAILAAAPDAILLDTAHGCDIAHLGARLAVHEAELGLPDGATEIVALVARPEAVLNARSFAGSSPRLSAIGWDAGRLAEAIFAQAGFRDGHWQGPLAQARANTRLAAAAAGVEAIETACREDQADALQAALSAARRDGFASMLVAAPAQVAPVKAAEASGRGTADEGGVSA